MDSTPTIHSCQTDIANLNSLKWALRQKATATGSSVKQPLSDIQYSAGFNILVRGLEWVTYRDFIIPQLSQLLVPLSHSRSHISVLEVGPGPKSILGHLPSQLRRKVRRYAAFEPNDLHAMNLEKWFQIPAEVGLPLPCLESPPDIRRASFDLDNTTGRDGAGTGARTEDGKYDVVLFCHSMYGMKPPHKFIERALTFLDKRLEGGMVVVFHRDGTLDFPGLVCHRTTSFPAGVVSVADEDETLDQFSAFIAGFTMQNVDTNKAIGVEWRKLCRALGRREETHAGHLLFNSPSVMMAFTRHATMLSQLTAHVPFKEAKTVKNREACLHRPASIIRPTEVQHVQRCVRWALEHRVGLTVVGGGHSGHCLWPGVVSVDMDAFDQVHIITPRKDEGNASLQYDSLVIAEAGCKTGDIIHKTLAAGLTVALGARPSVGAGLWLQGGIGHLARLHGLACDAIVGVVVVSVVSGEVLYIGHVPSQHRPVGAVRPDDAAEADLLWAIKGAGTNFGIVISVTFMAHPAPTYLTRNWIFPLCNDLEAQHRLSEFDRCVAKELPWNCSADAYLYWDAGQLHLGVTMFEATTTTLGLEPPLPAPTSVSAVLGPEDHCITVDGIGLFEMDMYMSGMHGGHGSGKTSSFKRCLFLNDIGAVNVADALVRAIQTRPSPLCYLHLLQGGGVVSDMAADAAAFGCRDWDFACVLTGVWPRDQDGTEVSRAVMQWVYTAVENLLPYCSGVYGADLGPDPRDAALATKAFGPNRPRLARLKRKWDPYNVLAYTCPLPKAPMEPKLIILVTGEHCTGKDYCAEIWTSVFTKINITARVVSISDLTKREYAAASGADLNRLLQDRTYKEQHRPALTKFFESQVRKRPRLPEEHFLNVVYGAVDVDVLLITGMRDEAPVAAFSHLVPDSRLLEVRVESSQNTWWVSRGGDGGAVDGTESDDNKGPKDTNTSRSHSTARDSRPSLIFKNDTMGTEAAERFAEDSLLPFVHGDLQRLANMVRSVSDFPRPSIEFRHVLGISQHPGGLSLCTSLLQNHFSGDWADIGALACCEAGGFIYASALATRVDLPLVLIREAGKLPPPIVSVMKSPSHISRSASQDPKKERIEMNQDAVPRGAPLVVVDDVLATGTTLCAVLELLVEAGIGAEDISVMVVAEFPAHRGRELLRRRGYGGVNIQSLLVFGGA